MGLSRLDPVGRSWEEEVDIHSLQAPPPWTFKRNWPRPLDEPVVLRLGVVFSNKASLALLFSLAFLGNGLVCGAGSLLKEILKKQVRFRLSSSFPLL